MSEDPLIIGTTNLSGFQNAAVYRSAVARTEFKRLMWSDARIQSLRRKYAERMGITKGMYRMAISDLNDLATALGHDHRSQLTADEIRAGFPLKTEVFWEFFRKQLENSGELATFESDIETFVRITLNLGSTFQWVEKELLYTVPSSFAMDVSGKENRFSIEVFPDNTMPKLTIESRDNETAEDFKKRTAKEINAAIAQRDGRMPSDFEGVKQDVRWFYATVCCEAKAKKTQLGIETERAGNQRQNVQHGVKRARKLLGDTPLQT